VDAALLRAPLAPARAARLGAGLAARLTHRDQCCTNVLLCQSEQYERTEKKSGGAMRLCSFEQGKEIRIGAAIDDEIVDLTGAAPELPREMCALLAAGEPALRAAQAAATRAKSRIALDSVRLHAPILRPPKFLAIGLNYADHIAEAKLET